MSTLPRVMGKSGSGVVATRGSKRKGCCTPSQAGITPAKDNAKNEWVWLPQTPCYKQILVALLIVFVLFLPICTCMQGW